MCNGGLCSICKYCFTICAFIYGFFHITLEMIETIVPIGLLIVALFSLALYIIRLPQPDVEVVESIIGKNLSESVNDPGGYIMRTIGHRGAGLDTPENTLAAFDNCFKKGCTAVEFDITLTADNIPIIFHDDNLERMTDSTTVIAATKWEDLEKVDLSIKHPFRDRFQDTRIPTLNDTVEQLLKSGQRMFFDVKSHHGKMINVILDLFEQYPELHSSAIVTSFYPNVLYYIRRSNPKIVSGLIWRPNIFSDNAYNAFSNINEKKTENYFKYFFLCLLDSLHEWFLTRLTYDILGCSVISLHKDVISPKVIRDWNDKGLRVIAWTVNHPVEKQYFARILKITYMTDTLTGEASAHAII